jgi:hypothetical protein
VGADGIFATSRIDTAARTEYVVAFNTTGQPHTVTVPTSTPSTTWSGLLGTPSAASGADARMSLTVPARGTVVLRSDHPLPTPPAPSVSVKTASDAITGKYRLTAVVPGIDPSSVTFLRREPAGWTVIGTDDARPFRVFVPPTGGRPVDIAAVVTDSSGAVAPSPVVRVRLVPFL